MTGAGEVDEDVVRDGAHPHGYLLVSAGTPAGADTAGWRVEPDLLPGTVLHLHPRTVRSVGRGGRGTVVLLGHPVDVAAGIVDGDRIATRLAGTWDLGGADALVREAAGLGGRWTLLASPHACPRQGELLVVPDTHATQPVFHAVSGGRLALASTPALVARTLGLDVDRPALDLLEELRARRAGATTYLPGRRTPYLGLDPLVPNCLLRVRLGSPPSVRHERFWPWQERVPTTDVGTVYQTFRERLTAHARLLAGLARPAVSLTAGWDSRVTAAVAGDTVRAGGGLAFTYVNPRDARRSAAAMADVTGASAVADRLGLPHRVLRWRQPPPGGSFDALHRRTYAPLVPSRGAAHAMWADLPRDLVQLQSNCGETGTTFLRHRTDEPLSPLRLARMMMHATEGLEDLAGQMYGDYQDYAAMTPGRMLGYDHHDLFYWEQRIGRWGWQKFTDGDLGHRILLPFNDRVLLETMLSLPYPQREAKVLFARVLDEHPRAHLPRRGAEPSGRTALPALARQVGARLPGRAGRLGRRMGERWEQGARDRARAARLDRLTWARGYAVLRGDPPARSWERAELPGAGAGLHVHPSLPHAVAAVEGGVVLVLGEPVDVPAGLVGAAAVARALAQDLGHGPGPDPARDAYGQAPALLAVAARAAVLAGSWLVLLATPGRTVVLADPLVSLGLHLSDDGSAIASHPGLLPGGTTSPGSDDVLVAAGPPGSTALHPTSLAALVDLPAAADAATGGGWSRRSRLERHAELLRRRGPAWLALTGGPASGELLGLLAGGPGVRTVSWWDRLADDADADDVVAASARAVQYGVPHRVLGLREDPDGSGGEPGRTARAQAAAALSATWPGRDDGADGAAALPLGDALDQALPPDAVLWLGERPRPPRPLGAPAGPVVTGRPTVLDLVQGVRGVALPLSDRLLALLPASAAPR